MRYYPTTERLVRVDSLVMLLDVPRRKGFYFKGESHDFWEGVFVYGGAVTATADEQVYQLDQGKLLFHKPMEFHRIWDGGGSSPRLVNLSFTASGEGMHRFENSCFDLDEIQQEHLWEVINTYKEVRKFGKKGELHEQYLAANRTAVLLEAFLLEMIEAGERSHRTLSGDEIRYAKIVNVMKENCHKMLSVADLAEKCDMSVSNMKRVFACFSDVGIAKFFMSLKMRRAMELLDSGIPAKEVSVMLDFEETSYFYTVFKRETGMTPNRYKKRRYHDIGHPDLG